MEERDILEEELPSFEFLASNHSSLTFYEGGLISFQRWCEEKNLWYLGWCNDTCYWNPLDNSHSPGFLFFNLEEEGQLWIHGFGKEKNEILAWIYSERALSQRFPNTERDALFRKAPYPLFEKFAATVFLENFQKPRIKEINFS